MESLLMPTLLAVVIAVLTTPLVAIAARRFGVVDHPGGRRIHRRSRVARDRLGRPAFRELFLLRFH